MSVADLMQAMADAGAPMEAIIIAVRALEEKDAVLAAKRAVERDRKRKQRGTVTGQSRDTDGTVTDIPSPQSPPLKSTPDPEKITPPLTPQPTKNCARGFRLPADWQPEPLTGKAAEMVVAWQAGELERELAKFKNYWLAKGGKDAAKTNWQRTWINWLISADERKPRNVRRNDQRDPTTVALEILASGTAH